ncbi:hypothetical protein [Lelliottia amnigena]|uniref:hypothetical protein n=1 Tax=Lelliottia amnigena TaxID=61646 RepID=UPI0040560391
MYSIRKRPALINLLYHVRHLIIPALVFATELTVWGALIRNGYAEYGWAYWRAGLLASVVILLHTNMIFYGSKERIWHAAGVLAPWVILVPAFIVFCFIQTNQDLLTLDWFFTGVFASGVFQWLFNVLVRNFR